MARETTGVHRELRLTTENNEMMGKWGKALPGSAHMGGEREHSACKRNEMKIAINFTLGRRRAASNHRQGHLWLPTPNLQLETADATATGCRNAT